MDFRPLMGLVLAVLSSFVMTAGVCAQDKFRISNLGTLGGSDSYGFAINQQGQVAGYSSTSGGTAHAFRSNGTSLQDLGALNSDLFSFGFGINNAGDVVGNSVYPSPEHAVRFSGNTLTDLGTLPGGVYSRARHVNDVGQVVGFSHISAGGEHAFLHANGSMQDLGVLSGGTFSRAFGINNSGMIAGWSQSTAGDRAFISDGSSLTPINPIGPYSLTYGYAINESNQIAGYMKTTGGSGAITHAFVYDGTNVIDLGVLAGGDMSIVDSGAAINNLGMVVGLSNTGTDSRAFLYAQGAMHDLNSLQSGNDWTLNDYARGINNLGQIAGSGRKVGQTGSRAYVATPELHYQPSVSGNWSDANVWSWGLTPGAPHPVYIDRAAAGTTVLTGPSVATAVAEINIGTSGAGTAELRLQSSGTLTLSAGIVGNAKLTIGSNGRLTGDGTVVGDVVVDGLGTIAPGVNGPGKISVGRSLTLQASANLEVDLGGDPTNPANEGVTFDVIIVSGSGNIFTLGAVNLHVTPQSGVVLNQPYVIVRAENGATVNYASLFANLVGGTHYDDGHVKYDVAYGGSQITVSFTSVPEPTSFIILPVIAILSFRRRAIL